MLSLRELKGAPLSCLIALWVLGRPASKQEISDETGYRASSIEDALRFLASPVRNLVLALPNGRHPKWALACKSEQVPLLFTRFKSDSGSGGSLIEIPSNTNILNYYNNLSREKSDSEISPELAPMVSRLVSCGCSEGRAIESIRKAVDRGTALEDIAQRIITSIQYIESGLAPKLRAPGYFVAACVEDGRTLPLPQTANGDWSGAGYTAALEESGDD